MSSFLRSLRFAMPPLLLLTVSACGEKPATEEEPAAPPAESVSEHMAKHFDQVKSIQEAVIRADIAAIRAPAQWLIDHEPVDGLPQGWEPYVTRMKTSAKAILDATDVPTFAAATSAMARTCGACHEALGAKPRFVAAAPPPEDTGTVSHMIGHMWAADRMWEGLIGPSQESWLNGTEVLVAAPLHAEVLSEEADQAQQVDSLAKKVHELAKEGREAADYEEAAKVYGDFLATCAECHRLLGKGPR